MLEADDETGTSALDKLHHHVRQGKFTRCRALVNECSEPSRMARYDEFDRLLISTLSWEVHDALGDWTVAAAVLNGQQWTECHWKISTALAASASFVAREFPSTDTDPKSRQGKYRLWRQRVMMVLAKAFSVFRAEDFSRAEKLLALAEKFLDECLGAVPVRGARQGRSVFPCSGTRCRLYYFRARLLMRQRKFDEAVLAFDRSTEFCFARLDEQLRKTNSSANPSRHQTERAFATYCLGKITVHMAEVALHQGRLRIARRHLLLSKVILRMADDEFLTRRAELLLCMVDREDQDIAEQGWALLSRFKSIGENIKGHPVFEIEASLEEATTAVYLLHERDKVSKSASKLGKPPQGSISSFAEAMRKVEDVISSLRRMKLPETLFHALLVKGRILTRLAEWSLAVAAIEEAEAQLKTIKPASARVPLAAEASVVRARSLEANGDLESALAMFQMVLTKAHESYVFCFSCHLHVFDLLLKTGDLGAAEACIAPCFALLANVDSTFQRNRFEALLKRLESQSKQTIDFKSPQFTLVAAQRSLRKRYVSYLAKLIDKKPSEILQTHNWNRLVRNCGVSAEDRPIVALALSEDFIGHTRAGKRRVRIPNRKTP